jgi:hypothetical protein
LNLTLTPNHLTFKKYFLSVDDNDWEKFKATATETISSQLTLLLRKEVN